MRYQFIQEPQGQFRSTILFRMLGICAAGHLRRWASAPLGICAAGHLRQCLLSVAKATSEPACSAKTALNDSH